MEPHDRLTQTMRQRMAELHIKTLRELATLADISYETLRSARSGESEPSQGTKSGLERALQYTYGSIDAILAGGEPTPVERPESGTEKPGERPDKIAEALEIMRQATEALRLAAEDPDVAREVNRRLASMGLGDGPPDTDRPQTADSDHNERRDTA